MRRHTFLFEPSRWALQGEFFDLAGNPVRATGEAIVSHEGLEWRSEGVVRLHWSERPFEFSDAYRVRPFGGMDWTPWEAEMHGLGLVRGKFVLADDVILCLGQSMGGAFALSECLVMLGPDRYLRRGALVKGSGKMSSWAVELARVS